MSEEKQIKRSTGFRVDDATMQQITALMQVDGSRSFQQFCERAVEFYIGYLSAEKKDGYLSDIIETTLRSLFSQFESTIRRDQCKIAIAVEELMLAQMLSTRYTQDELSRIRGRAAEMIRHYGGPSSLGKAQKEIIRMFPEVGEDVFPDS